MLRRLNILLCASLLLSCTVAAADFPVSSAKPDDKQKILAGYFEEWSIYYANYNLADMEANGTAGRLSHLLYAFGNVTPTGCQIADAWADFENNNLPPVGGIADNWPLFGNFAELQKLHQLHPKLKILIALGGASTSNTQGFAAAASTPEGRQALAASCIDMFIKGNVGSDWNGDITAPGLFDGFMIDWEFPSAEDKQNYTFLLQEFRRQLNQLTKETGKQYVLANDAPAGAQNFRNMDLPKVAAILDFVTIDGYNYEGSWDTVTNHASALFDAPENPDFGKGLFIDSTVSAYLTAGVPARKIVLGVPLYGAGWRGVSKVNHGLYQPSTGPAVSPSGDGLDTDGVATYRTLKDLPGYTKTFDLKRLSVSLYNPDDQTFWTLDDPSTATLKSAYINLRVPGGLGGAFVWALKDDDANGTMVTTLANGLGR